MQRRDSIHRSISSERASDEHAARNSLAAILGLSNLMSESPDPQARQYARLIQENGEALMGLMERLINGDPPKPEADVTALPHDRFDGRSALVVDDNPSVRHGIVGQLSSMGFSVRETGSPKEALGWIEHGDPFDVALFDVRMPELDGITLARRVRMMRSPTELPIVMLTALGWRSEVAKPDDEIAAFLSKPARADDLARVLGGALDARDDPATQAVST